jgi:hypothetical protein
MNLKSIRLNNLVRAARILVDSMRGLDFLIVSPPRDIAKQIPYAIRSSPSGNAYLARLLRHIGITAMDSIIDVGCEKGSAMRTMLRFPFARIDGLELSEYLAAIARANFRKLRETRSMIFVCNAATFKEFDAYNFVYFYDPFPETVMSKVIENLMHSIQRAKRKVTIIYNNPTCSGTILATKAFRLVGDFPAKWHNRIFVFASIDGPTET